MEREITGKRPHFRPQKRRSNPYRVLLWLILIAVGVWLMLGLENGQVKPLFLPTPTPTRVPNSYILEGESLFKAGDLEGAIRAYQQAAEMGQDAKTWAELARIQTYSSSLLSSDDNRLERLKQARSSIDQAISINPDDATAQAFRAFTLDWYAGSPLIDDEERQTALNDAEAAAVRALQIDSENPYALAFFAEILVDQQKWSQAQETVAQAVAIEERNNTSIMDVHRVYGYVWESLGQYRLAIEEYQQAAKTDPNLTFLYIFIGRNYLELEVHNRALEEFQQAASINEQLGIKDPVPYIEIAKTYTRDGEFFVAALNAEKALSFDPTNANTYGQLGMIYTQARNYEGAKPALKCAVIGCTAEENEVGNTVVQGLPLTQNTVWYYLRYASVLAALSRKGQNYCQEALQVQDTVHKKYPDDSIFNDIIDENKNICAMVQK